MIVHRDLVVIFNRYQYGYRGNEKQTMHKSGKSHGYRYGTNELDSLHANTHLAELHPDFTPVQNRIPLGAVAQRAAIELEDETAAIERERSIQSEQNGGGGMNR